MISMPDFNSAVHNVKVKVNANIGETNKTVMPRPHKSALDSDLLGGHRAASQRAGGPR